MGRRLYEVVRERARTRGLSRALEEIYSEVAEGKIALVDPRPPKTFPGYLVRPAYSLWLYTALALLISTLLVIPLSRVFPGILPIRYLLGAMYVLFLPGYSLIEALYPEEGQLSPLERLALSIGLSLAVVPLIGLVLNYTPWGIRLTPYVAASSLYISTLLVIAAYRKYSILRERQQAIQRASNPRGRPGGASR